MTNETAAAVERLREAEFDIVAALNLHYTPNGANDLMNDIRLVCKAASENAVPAERAVDAMVQAHGDGQRYALDDMINELRSGERSESLRGLLQRGDEEAGKILDERLNIADELSALLSPEGGSGAPQRHAPRQQLPSPEAWEQVINQSDTPAPDTGLREQVAIALCKLSFPLRAWIEFSDEAQSIWRERADTILTLLTAHVQKAEARATVKAFEAAAKMRCRTCGLGHKPVRGDADDSPSKDFKVAVKSWFHFNEAYNTVESCSATAIWEHPDYLAAKAALAEQERTAAGEKEGA